MNYELIIEPEQRKLYSISIFKITSKLVCMNILLVCLSVIAVYAGLTSLILVIKARSLDVFVIDANIAMYAFFVVSMFASVTIFISQFAIISELLKRKSRIDELNNFDNRLKKIINRNAESPIYVEDVEFGQSKPVSSEYVANLGLINKSLETGIYTTPYNSKSFTSRKEAIRELKQIAKQKEFELLSASAVASEIRQLKGI